MSSITIRSSALRVAISPLGAELQSIRDAREREYLHDGASYWTGRAPLLFPIVGALKEDSHAVDGVVYHLPKHGFARRSRFDTAGISPDRVLFRLEDSEASRAQYPYKFCLDVVFAVAGTKLTTTATVTNTDARPIPVAFGFHPAFRWPLPGAGGRLAQVIDFALEEAGPVTRIGADGLLSRELPSPVKGNRLALADSLFDDDALIFLTLNSRSLQFGPADRSSPSLKIDFAGMPHLGIWTKPGGALFLCIEPWSGYASPHDFSGPLTRKPGSINLAPGEVKTFEMSAELI